MDMFKIEYRAVIKFLTLQGQSPSEVFEQLKGVYGERSPSYDIVKRWAREFRLGRESIADEPRPGRPIAESSDRDVAAVSKLVTEDRRLKVREIAYETGLPPTTVHRILTEELGLRKLYAKWVPSRLRPNTRLNELIVVGFLASFFWDSKGVLLLNYQLRSSTMNAKCYFKLLRQLT